MIRSTIRGFRHALLPRHGGSICGKTGKTQASGIPGDSTYAEYELAHRPLAPARAAPAVLSGGECPVLVGPLPPCPDLAGTHPEGKDTPRRT